MKKKKERNPLPLMALRIDEWDKSQIQENADRFAKGNLSAWLRYAGRVYRPKKGEKIPLKAG